MMQQSTKTEIMYPHLLQRLDTLDTRDLAALYRAPRRWPFPFKAGSDPALDHIDNPGDLEHNILLIRDH